MAVIQLPDEHVVALKSKAESVGMTLEEWLGVLSAVELPVRRSRRYKLEDLIAQCDLNAPLTDEDRAWLDAPPVGREVV